MDDVDVAASEMDGLWFSRKRHDGSETWELRRLFGTPFAMLAVIDDDMTTEEAARTLSEIESRMAATSLKISGKNKFA